MTSTRLLGGAWFFASPIQVTNFISSQNFNFLTWKFEFSLVERKLPEKVQLIGEIGFGMKPQA